MKLFVLLFVWGPALLGYALGWLVHHPSDWSGPAFIALLGALLTFVSYRSGLRRLGTLSRELRPVVIGAMIASAVIGVMIFGMLALRVIG
jgi:hypothetical protein